MKKLLTAIAIAVLSMGCTGEIDAPESETCIHDPSPPPESLEYRMSAAFVIDENFTEEQKLRMVSAITHWSYASGYRFDPSVTFSPVVNNQNEGIIAATSFHPTIQQFEKDNPAYKGNLAGLQMGRTIWMVTDRLLDPQRFENVALHEVGHYLGLGHSLDPVDVMAPNAAGDCVSYEDINIFCSRWGCDPTQVKVTCVNPR